MEDNKKLVHQYFEAFSTGNVGIFDEIMSSDFYVSGLHQKDVPPAEQRGPKSFKEATAAWRISFPDGQVTLDEMVAEGDTVMARWTFQGTHAGEFAGLAPTHRQITYSGINGFRIVNGKLVEAWDMWDR
jgi:steroid delta-isomerase-like uncharacterized protein